MTNHAFHVGRCERMDRTDVPTFLVPAAAIPGHGIVFLEQVVAHVSCCSRVHTAPISGRNDPDIAATGFRRDVAETAAAVVATAARRGAYWYNFGRHTAGSMESFGLVWLL